MSQDLVNSIAAAAVTASAGWFVWVTVSIFKLFQQNAIMKEQLEAVREEIELLREVKFVLVEIKAQMTKMKPHVRKGDPR